jgi:WD40 repeat protein
MKAVRRHFTALIIPITLYFIISCSALSSLNFGASYKILSPENANRLALVSKLPFFIDATGYFFDEKKTTMLSDSIILLYPTLQSGSNRIKIVENSSILLTTFSPDGKRMVAMTYDKTDLWNAENGTKVAELPTKRGYATFSPDGKVIATTSPWAFEETGEGTTVQLWNASDGKAIKSLTVPHRAGFHVAFSDDGKTLAIGTVSGAYLWDMKSDQPNASFAGTDMVLQIGFSPNNRQLVALSPRVRIWDIAEEKELTYFQNAHDGNVNGAIFSPDNSVLVTWGEDHKAKVWDMAGGTERSFENLSDAVVDDIGFSPDGKRLSILNENTISEWDTTNGKQLTATNLETDCGEVKAVSPDWQLAACETKDQELMVWDVLGAKSLTILKDEDDLSFDGNNVHFSSDGKFLAADYNGYINHEFAFRLFVFGVR